MSVLPETPTRLRAPPVALHFPLKYHVFISPSLRRIYLGDGEDTSRALIDDLNTEITLLKARVGTLRRDKDLLMDRCEAAQSAVSRLTSDERNARLELVKAKEEARLANLSFESLKVVYRSLESIHSDCPPDTKRKSGEAALDSSSSIDSPASSPRKVKVFACGRPVKPMPKRARLQPTTTQNPPALTATPRFADPEKVFRPSVFFLLTFVISVLLVGVGVGACIHRSQCYTGHAPPRRSLRDIQQQRLGRVR
ncbi:hypothetical protein EDB84DRAFT_300623 [Lactarius hengduanensis]|nr:hypothetical protein EDB84DRAFT_300623 [Lactarius hengduanensis]